jgi:hypothetical protein
MLHKKSVQKIINKPEWTEKETFYLFINPAAHDIVEKKLRELYEEGMEIKKILEKIVNFKMGTDAIRRVIETDPFEITAPSFYSLILDDIGDYPGVHDKVKTYISKLISSELWYKLCANPGMVDLVEKYNVWQVSILSNPNATTVPEWIADYLWRSMHHPDQFVRTLHGDFLAHRLMNPKFMEDLRGNIELAKKVIENMHDRPGSTIPKGLYALVGGVPYTLLTNEKKYKRLAHLPEIFVRDEDKALQRACRFFDGKCDVLTLDF